MEFREEPEQMTHVPDPDTDPSEWSFEILWYDDETGYALCDGTGRNACDELPLDDRMQYEYAQRLSRLEAEIQSVRASTSRIEDQVGDLSDTIAEVDEESLDNEKFEELYRDDIEQNTRITNIVKWAGGAAVVLMTAFLTLVQIMGGV